MPAGVEPVDLKGLSVVDQDGQVTENAFDLDFEQRLLHTLQKPNRVTGVAGVRGLADTDDLVRPLQAETSSARGLRHDLPVVAGAPSS